MSRDRRERAALRLAAHGLVSRSHPDAASVARAMLASQGQDLAGVRRSIALRMHRGTERAVAAALDAGEIVRSWPLRGTLHVTAPEDLGWLLRIARVRQATASAARRAELEITDQMLDAAARVCHELMAGGRFVRRDVLIAAFQAAGVPTHAQRAYHLLWNLGHRAVIVFGPQDGAQPTFCLFDERITSSRDLEGDEALAEIALRHMTARGPATDRDLAWWASITLSDARRGIAAVADRLQTREFDGVTHWFAKDLEPSRMTTLLMPGFDEYLLGYQDRSTVLDPRFAERIVPGKNGIFQPTIIARGEVVGTWRLSTVRGAATITPEYFEQPSASVRRAVGSAALRWAGMLQQPVAVSGEVP